MTDAIDTPEDTSLADLPNPARALVSQVKVYAREVVEAAVTGNAELAAVGLSAGDHPEAAVSG